MLVAQVQERATLLQGDARRLLASDDDRRAAVAVARGVERAVFGDQQNGTAAADLFLHVAQALHERIPRGDHRRNDFRRAHHAARRRILQLGAVRVEKLLLEFLDVRDQTHRHDGEHPELRADHERLRVGVRNDADARVAGEPRGVFLQLRAERRVLDVVDGALEARRAQHRQTAPVRAEVRMVVRAEEKIAHAIALRDDTAKSAHVFLLPSGWLRIRARRSSAPGIRRTSCAFAPWNRVRAR